MRTQINHTNPLLKNLLGTAICTLAMLMPASAMQCPAITDFDIVNELLGNLNEDYTDGTGNLWEIISLYTKTPHNPLGTTPGDFRNYTIADPILNAWSGPLLAGAIAQTPFVPDPVAHPGPPPHPAVQLTVANAGGGVFLVKIPHLAQVVLVPPCLFLILRVTSQGTRTDMFATIP